MPARPLLSSSMTDTKTKLGNITFVAFDTETTGTGPGTRLIEIAGSKFRGDEFIDRFEMLIDPGMPIPKETIRIHRITDEMVRGQPDASVALQQFFEFVEGCVLVAHNASFDAAMVGLELTRRRSPAPKNPILDSLRAARRMFPAGAHSLDALIDLLGLPRQDERHRAFGDAELVRHLVRKMVESLGGDDHTFGELTEQTGTPLLLETFVLEPPKLPFPMKLLEAACREGTKVNLHLDSGGARAQQRIVSPEVYYEWSGVGILEAYCAEEGCSKHFRLDRLLKAEPGASSGFLF